MAMANAADLTVYNNGLLGTGINAWGWWAAGMDFTAENPTGGDTKVFSLKADNGGADFSMGLQANGQEAVTGPLHNATLTFGWYATGTATCNIRVTATGGKEQDYSWKIEASSTEWATITLPVESTFPEVAAQWNDYVGKGEGYVFGIVISGASEDFQIFFDNIRYADIDEAWEAPYVPEIVPPTTVPEIAQEKDDVLSIFSAYGNHPFNIGGWGQATVSEDVTIDGKEAKKLTRFNYLGWELQPSVDVTGYDYVHVDFYPCEETTFGFTIISPGQEKAWIAPTVNLNEWNSYDAPLTFWNNVNLADIFQMKFDQGQMAECYLANVYFYKKEGGDTPEPVEPVTGSIYTDKVNAVAVQNMGDGDKEYPYVLDYKIIYNDDKTLTIVANFIWADGQPIGMVPGSVFVNNQINDFTTDNPREVTTTESYEAGITIPVNFYIPMAMGVVQKEIMYTVGSDNQMSSVAVVETAIDEAPVYYTTQGIRVENPGKGLYIRVANGKATKVLF